MRFIPIGDRIERRFAYVVITETDEDRRPPTDKRSYHDYYYKGQIVVCEVNFDGGGIPIEVGTWGDPGKQNCKYKQFDLLSNAINCAYAVAHGKYDDGEYKPRKKGYRHGSPKRSKKRRQVRHQA